MVKVTKSEVNMEADLDLEDKAEEVFLALGKTLAAVVNSEVDREGMVSRMELEVDILMDIDLLGTSKGHDDFY